MPSGCLLHCEHRRLPAQHGCNSKNICNFSIKAKHSLIERGRVVTSQSPPRPIREHLAFKKKMQSILWMVPIPSSHSCSQSSKTSAQHRTWKLVAITGVVAPSTVISSFYGDPTGMACKYLHGSKDPFLFLMLFVLCHCHGSTVYNHDL